MNSGGGSRYRQEKSRGLGTGIEDRKGPRLCGEAAAH